MAGDLMTRLVEAAIKRRNERLEDEAFEYLDRGYRFEDLTVVSDQAVRVEDYVALKKDIYTC